MNKTKSIPRLHKRMAFHRPGLFRFTLMAALLASVCIAAVRVNMDSHNPHQVLSAAAPQGNRVEQGARSTAVPEKTLSGRQRKVSFSPQVAPSGWTLDTVSPVQPLPNCGPMVEITGFGYDPSNRAVVGWDLFNRCGGSPGSRWARKELGAWNITVFEPGILFPGGADSDYAHQLALRPDGTPFMVFGAVTVPWVEYYYAYEANLDSSPAGPGVNTGEDTTHYRSCYQSRLRFALGFSPGGTSPNRVTRIGCTTQPGGGMKLNGSVFNPGYVQGFDYATGPAGQHHVVSNDDFGRLSYSNGTPGSLNPIAVISGLSENISIAADANNRIHAAIGGLNPLAWWHPGNLAYMTSADGVNWTSTIIDGLDRNTGAVSLALDSSGSPAIAYVYGEAVWYAVLNNGQWDKVQVRPVISNPNLGSVNLRLKFDGNDVPHIAFYDTTTSSVVIANPGGMIGDPPTIACPQNISVNNDPGQCSASVSFAVTATGAPAPTVTYKVGNTVITSPHAFPVGDTTIICTAANDTLPDAICSFTVTVNDSQPPTLTCPADITRSADPNQCSAAVTYTPPTANDNCPKATVGCSPPSGSTFLKGTTTVACTATDASGNSSTCSFTVSVNDLQPPSIACPANIVKSTDLNQCSAVATFATPTVSDNCPGVGAPACNPPSGSTFSRGTTAVTCSVTDSSGNSSGCSFTVTVNDTQAPTITCPANITAVTDQNICPPSGQAPCKVVNFPNSLATDNCQGAPVVCTPASGSCFPTGTTTVTCTASDASGNRASCSFTVSVFDVCLQDDSNANTVLLFNSQTGDYRFCSNGVSIIGRGNVSRRGCLYTLVHNTPDRRLLATLEKNLFKGAAALVILQPALGSRLCTIIDRDSRNNACACQGSPD